MLNDDIIGKVKIAILIGIVIVAVMGCGCIEKYIVSLPHQIHHRVRLLRLLLHGMELGILERVIY